MILQNPNPFPNRYTGTINGILRNQTSNNFLIILIITSSNLSFIYSSIDISVFVIIMPGGNSAEGSITAIKISSLVAK